MDNRGKRILDPCCGSKMFYFDKHNDDVLFCDIRELDEPLCDGRKLEIHPDMICDFTSLPFDDESFWHVVFDPPHMITLGEGSWMAKKYGRLPGKWENILHDGFHECMRVLKENGTLIFKWNETDIPTSDVIDVIGVSPIYGHLSGKNSQTQWMAFVK